MDLKKELENYIGKLGTPVVDSKIQFSVNFMFKRTKRVKTRNSGETRQNSGILSQALIFNSETGAQVTSINENICPESPDNSIYFMQNPRIGNSECLTFFHSGANSHLIDGQLAEKEELQLISSEYTILGFIGE